MSKKPCNFFTENELKEIAKEKIFPCLNEVILHANYGEYLEDVDINFHFSVTKFGICIPKKDQLAITLKILFSEVEKV